MRASLMLTLGFFLGFLFAGSFAYSQTTEQPWIESGADKAAIARHSKSPDGRNALAWVVAGDQGTITGLYSRAIPTASTKNTKSANFGLSILARRKNFAR